MNEKLFLEGYPFYFWGIEEQTKRKHKVLADYIENYFKILGSLNDEVCYVDCFGGCGAYLDDENEVSFGSPVLAAIIAQKYASTGAVSGNKRAKIKICIIDKNTDNLANIKSVIEFLNIHANVNYIHGDFNSEIHRVIRQKKNIPTFYFVDPFGYSLDCSTLESMMKGRAAEIFLNFMYNGINRGISVHNVEDTICNLFGCDEWKTIRDLNSTERENACIELFKHRLKDISAFVKEYKVSFPEKDRTYYYLIHLTNNAKGANIMRYSFGKYNDGHLEYRGKKEIQLSLFDTPAIKNQEIEDILFQKYKGVSRKFVNIIIDLFESKYYETDIRKTLLDMERDNKISVKRNPPFTQKNKPRTGLSDEDIVVFKERFT